MRFLEELGALASMGAIFAAIDQQHRDLEVEHALPLRYLLLLATAAGAFFRARALGEDLEAAGDAAAVTQRELFRRHQLGMEEIGLHQFLGVFGLGLGLG